MHPKFLKIQDFSYELPAEKIATYPLSERDNSKLLIYKGGAIAESKYQNLAEELPQKTLLVFNNTKVVEARIIFQKASGGTIEIFCLEPGEKYADITTAMLQKRTVQWKCLVGGAKKWKEEFLIKKLKTDTHNISLSAKIAEKKNDCFLIDFFWDADISFAEILHAAGLIPLPPYLNRDAEENDKVTYQTVYAKHDGSVAAPTAGLHFTDALFEKLKLKKIESSFVTLHVGAGTFKPVKAAEMKDHEMHAEFIDVHESLIELLLNSLDKPIVAVGTTSLRTIESLFWMGVKLSEKLKAQSTNISIEDISVMQWDPYELDATITAKESLQLLFRWMKDNNIKKILSKTQIIIAPGYTLKIAKGLITNFHQPQSTLLLLVSALIGKDWKKVYQYALENNFRFLSYGDGSLIWRND